MYEYDEEDYYEPNPRYAEQYQDWIDRERDRGLRYVHSAFRNLRISVGLATMDDMLASIYEPIILKQLQEYSLLERMARPNPEGTDNDRR